MLCKKSKLLKFYWVILLNLACTNNIQQVTIADFANKRIEDTYTLHENEALYIDRKHTITVDLAIPKNKLNAPIVLVLHGNHSRKEAHRNHILELAKSGFIGMALQFKNSGQWYQNGRLLARTIPRLKDGISIGGNIIKGNDIILVGHSFGGYASVVAAGTYQQVNGSILLDPAMFNKRGPSYLSKIASPTIIIGADKRIFRSRKRDLFFKKLVDRKIEFSVLSATHDDAQNPSMFAISSYGIDPYTSEKNQELITNLIVEGAHALVRKNGLITFKHKISLLERQSKIAGVRIGPATLPKQNRVDLQK